MRVFSIVLVSMLLAAMVLSLVACAPSLSEQIALTNSSANLANAQAASIRAEGDRAVQEAQATAITLSAMQMQTDQQMMSKLVWLQEASNDGLENTWWLIVLSFGVLTVLFAVIGLQVLVLIEMRKLNERSERD